MHLLLLSLILTTTCVLFGNANAESLHEKEIFTGEDWTVSLEVDADERSYCIARNWQNGQSNFDLQFASNSFSIGIFYGEDVEIQQLETFRFKIDNFPIWQNVRALYDNGWLIGELSGFSDKTLAEMERQLRKGRTFFHLDDADDIITAFSLKGSDLALTALVECLEKYISKEEVVSEGSTKQSETKEMLIGQVQTGFELGYSTEQDEFIMSEWIPNGESLQDWTQMITLQALLDYPPDRLETFVSRFIELVNEDCGNIDSLIISEGLELEYAYKIFATVCEKNPKTQKPEATILKAIAGDEALYVVQKAWKYSPTQKEMNDWVNQLADFVVCGEKNNFSYCN